MAFIGTGTWFLPRDQIFFTLLILVGAAIFIFMGKQVISIEKDHVRQLNLRLFHSNDYRRPIAYTDLKEVVYVDGEHKVIFIVLKFVQHLTGSASANNYWEFHYKDGRTLRWKAFLDDDKNRVVQKELMNRINQ